MEKVNCCRNCYSEIAAGKEFIAVSKTPPVVGEPYLCYKVVPQNLDYPFEFWETSPVQEIEQIGRKIYKVKTLNSTYIVLVTKF